MTRFRTARPVSWAKLSQTRVIDTGGRAYSNPICDLLIIIAGNLRRVYHILPNELDSLVKQRKVVLAFGRLKDGPVELVDAYVRDVGITHARQVGPPHGLGPLCRVVVDGQVETARPTVQRGNNIGGVDSGGLAMRGTQDTLSQECSRAESLEHPHDGRVNECTL